MKVIVVPHTLEARVWEVKSLLDAAKDEGLEIENFNSMDDVKKMFPDGEIPESYLRETSKKGFPCFHVYDNGSINYWEGNNFDAEQAALEFLLADYESVICIHSKAEAEKIAKTYEGNQHAKVRELARKIAKEMEA